MYNRLTDEQLLEANHIFGSLSPENLTCDGEADMRTVRARSRKLNKRLAEIEAEAGFRLDELETYREFDRRQKRGLKYPSWQEMLKKGWL